MKQIGKMSNSQRCRIEVLLLFFIIFPDFRKYEVIVLRKIRKIIGIIILYFLP